MEAMIERQENNVIVATSAFGLGMDFVHLDWVVLWHAPVSLLAMAQAIGRVARNGRPGEALILWDEDDFRLLEWMVETSEQKKKELMRVRGYLEASGCKKHALTALFESEPRLLNCTGQYLTA